MGKINRIQLRGISRSPSDRMTNDGACAESLNVYLDNDEVAPVLVPDDVTGDLGLPDGLKAERIFIHKTASYENTVTFYDGTLAAYTANGKVAVLELHADEILKDITSVGNTLIIATSDNLYYVLYKDKQYVNLGNKVPFPYVNIEAKKEEQYYPIFDSRLTAVNIGDNGEKREEEEEDYNGAWLDSLPTEEVWNEDFNKDLQTHSDADILRLLTSVWAKIDEKKNDILKAGCLYGGVVARYSVTLYDESELSSVPILLSDGFRDALKVRLDVKSKWYRRPSDNKVVVTEKYNEYKIEVPIYRIYANMESVIPEEWNDIIKAVNIYISDFPLSPMCRTMSYMTDREMIEDEEWTSSFRGTIHLGDREDKEFLPRILQASARTHLVNQGSIKDPANSGIDGAQWEGLGLSLNDLKDGKYLDLSRLIDVSLDAQPILVKDDMKHYALTASRLDTYNNQTLLIGTSQIIDYDYNNLNALDTSKREEGDNRISTTYDVTYLLKADAGDKVVKKSFTYGNTDSEVKKALAFQIFPDSRAYRMLVKATVSRDVKGTIVEMAKYGDFEMKPHPYLDCAYFYGDTSHELADLCYLVSVPDYPVDVIDDQENKVLASEQSNPFFFPLKNRFTFQSRVIGLAVATTALSQGQFGQYPLYVFTEDGIWAMETSADGSFVTSKPLSRDVCINPDSITSIDNAVVFVTKKGVMMIQGSSVVCISSNMTGKKYMPGDAVRDLVASQHGFCSLSENLAEDDSFMTYMSQAKIAYDYAGQRLIFIHPAKRGYQYTYEIATDSWHKMALDGIYPYVPINSYPECLVLTKPTREDVLVVFFSSPDLAYKSSVIKKFHEKMGGTVTIDDATGFIEGKTSLGIDLLPQIALAIAEVSHEYAFDYTLKREVQKEEGYNRVLSFSTVLDGSAQETAKGIMITRTLDLGEPDVLKTITDVRVRGQFDRRTVKFILLGSNDGLTFSIVNTLRGKAWKLFRIVVLADLGATDRISWIDVMFETKLTNRLR